jgi:hypothetical protein
VGYSCGGGHLFELGVRRAEDGVGDYAHHALGGCVVRGHHLLPVVETGPGAVVPDGVGGHEHSVGVGDGASSYGVAVEDDDVAEETDVEEAAQTEFGLPEVAVEGPVGLGEAFGGPAAAHLDDQDFVAFFGEAQGRDAATEAGSDDEEVIVEGRHRWGLGGE